MLLTSRSRLKVGEERRQTKGGGKVIEQRERKKSRERERRDRGELTHPLA